MDQLEAYLKLAERPNTGRSYAAAVKHFEQEWRGVLPATPDSIAQYLADYASSLSINTLKLRLAGLSRWHLDHGFPDPTKAKVVTQVLKGIRAAHSVPEKQAKPLQLQQLQQVVDWLVQPCCDPPEQHLRHARDSAMLLIGFWRGFRADELIRLVVENVTVEPGVGMRIYLPRSKGDRNNEGRDYACPALSRLCPIAAYENWMALSGITDGPVFRKIDRWGNLGDEAMQAGSIIPWLRHLFKAAGIAEPELYSSHSLRRGFAGWARSSGWDLKELMEYVGWKDVATAARYLDTTGDDLQARFEKGLPPLLNSPSVSTRAEAVSPIASGPKQPKRKTILRVVK